MLLPSINACLNATAATLLLFGYVAIRRGRRAAHQRLMLAAFACSTLFLTGYVIHHARVGSVRFAGGGLMRGLYFAILVPHTVLAVAVVPLALLTLTSALRGQFGTHRNRARLTLPVWLFVSASGVAVYLMLYHF